MEHITTHLEGDDAFRDTWDAVPRDGPAVFIVKTDPFDERGRIVGRWIDPTGSIDAIDRQITELIGSLANEGGWAVIDQIGLGPEMLPEELTLEALRRMALRRRTAP